MTLTLLCRPVGSIFEWYGQWGRQCVEVCGGNLSARSAENFLPSFPVVWIGSRGCILRSSSIHVKLRWEASKRGQVAKYLDSLRVGRQCGWSRHGVEETCINSEQSNCHAMSTVNWLFTSCRHSRILYHLTHRGSCHNSIHTTGFNEITVV